MNRDTKRGLGVLAVLATLASAGALGPAAAAMFGGGTAAGGTLGGMAAGTDAAALGGMAASDAAAGGLIGGISGAAADATAAGIGGIDAATAAGAGAGATGAVGATTAAGAATNPWYQALAKKSGESAIGAGIAQMLTPSSSSSSPQGKIDGFGGQMAAPPAPQLKQAAAVPFLPPTDSMSPAQLQQLKLLGLA